jgi:hypothetical protein
MENTLETIGQDFDEARAKLQAARQRLQEAPQDVPEIRQAVERLDRMEAGIVVREGLVGGQGV